VLAKWSLANAVLKSTFAAEIGTLVRRGHEMKQVDYVQMAEKCTREANRLPPGPERDELLKKVELFESYAKIDNWIASPGLQPPS
jgi:hypothetical protein